MSIENFEKEYEKYMIHMTHFPILDMNPVDYIAKAKETQSILRKLVKRYHVLLFSS